jgi:hypothetical protein
MSGVAQVEQSVRYRERVHVLRRASRAASASSDDVARSMATAPPRPSSPFSREQRLRPPAIALVSRSKRRDSTTRTPDAGTIEHVNGVATVILSAQVIVWRVSIVRGLVRRGVVQISAIELKQSPSRTAKILSSFNQDFDDTIPL